jgi:hypothetical protein
MEDDRERDPASDPTGTVAGFTPTPGEATTARATQPPR